MAASNILRLFPLVLLVWLGACKPTTIKNIRHAGGKPFLSMECQPFGVIPIYVSSDMSPGEEWEKEQIDCVNWIQENWTTLWPLIHEKMDEMASRYAYGEQRLEPHLRNAKNSLVISPTSKGEWSIALEIELEHGGHAFCIEFDHSEVIHYQPVY